MLDNIQADYSSEREQVHFPQKTNSPPAGIYFEKPPKSGEKKEDLPILMLDLSPSTKLGFNDQLHC